MARVRPSDHVAHCIAAAASASRPNPNPAARLRCAPAKAAASPSLSLSLSPPCSRRQAALAERATAAASLLCAKTAVAAPALRLRLRLRDGVSSSRGACLVFSCSASSSPPAEGGGFSGKVGFLGLGIMGAPMASNLIKAGCDVTVWNRTKSKCDPLLTLGAKYESSPADVASSCDVTFAMLADPESALTLHAGPMELHKGWPQGKGTSMCRRLTLLHPS